MISDSKNDNVEIFSAAYLGFHLLLSLVLILAVVLQTMFGSSSDLEAAYAVGRGENFFSYDLLNFVTAFRLFAEAKSPYVAGAQNAVVDAALGGVFPHQLNFLYSPMTLVVFSPLLWAPYSLLQGAWLLLGVLAVSTVADLLTPGGFTKPYRLAVIGVSISFAPFLSAIYWGQYSAFVVLFLTIGLCLAQRNKFFLSGIFFGVCVIKPQIWFLAAIGLLLWCVRTKRFSVLLGMFVSIAGLSAVAEFWLPGIHSQWIGNLASVQGHAELSLTPTFGGILRYGLISVGVSAPEYLPRLVSVFAALLITSFFVIARLRSLPLIISIGMMLSALCAPYSWFHDQTAIIVPLLIHLHFVLHRPATIRLTIIAVVSLGTTVLATLCSNSQHELVLFGLVCNLLFWSLFAGGKSLEFADSYHSKPQSS